MKHFFFLFNKLCPNKPLYTFMKICKNMLHLMSIHESHERTGADAKEKHYKFNLNIKFFINSHLKSPFV